MNIEYIITVIINDIAVALAAPIIPNFDINNPFNTIFTKAQRALILNEIFTFPIFDNVPPIATIGA